MVSELHKRVHEILGSYYSCITRAADASRPAAIVPTRRDLLRDSAPREESRERRVGGVFRRVTAAVIPDCFLLAICTRLVIAVLASVLPELANFFSRQNRRSASDVVHGLHQAAQARVATVSLVYRAAPLLATAPLTTTAAPHTAAQAADAAASKDGPHGVHLQARAGRRALQERRLTSQ